MSDEALLELLATDLRGNYEQLIHAYQDLLYRFALRVTHNHSDAEDVLQEVLVRAYYALEKYPSERIRTLKLKAWLYTITSRQCYKVVDPNPAPLVSLPVSGESSFADLPADPQEQPESTLERAEFLEELIALMETLPPRYREPVFLFYFEGLSYREIATQLGLSPENVKARIFRGKTVLRTKLLHQTLLGKEEG